MNRTKAAIVVLVLAGFGTGFYAAFRTRTATLTWDYDYEKNPPCNAPSASSGGEKSCVIGFKIFLGPPTSRREQEFIANRFDQSGHIISKKISGTLPVRPYGQVQFCVVAVATAENGGTVESLPLCVVQHVLPLGPGKIKK
jgi:hypothetical protein